MTGPIPVSEEAVTAALAADAEWMRKSRRPVFVSPARDQVRVMLEAAAPMITAGAEAKLAELRRLAIEVWGGTGTASGRALLAILGTEEGTG